MALSTGDCAKCGQPTTQRCSRCSEGANVDGTPSRPVLYCGKECQQTDFKHHKKECRHAKDRKQFYRAADILQQLYFAFREATFQAPLTAKIENGKVYISYGQGYADLLYPLPKNVTSNPELKKAVLTYNNCREAQLYLKEFTSKLFAGLSLSTEPKTIELNMEPSHKKVFHYDRFSKIDRNDKLHQVMQVTLSDGINYAFDLAGAQYGQYRAAMPLDVYKAEYASEWNDMTTNFRRNVTTFELGGGPKVSRIGENVIERLVKSTLAWEKEHKMTVAALLDKKLAVFQAEKEGLVTKLSNEMFEHVRALVHHGHVHIGK